jgi:hypothetical protein
MSEEAAEYRTRPPGMTPQYDLDIRAKLAYIDALLADHDRIRQQILFAPENRLAPWQLACVGMTTGAALFAAGGAFVKLLGL